MSTLLSDLRYAARMLWHNPGFTLVALLALGLGIGATSAIYSVVDAILLRPLPFSQPEQLLHLASLHRGKSANWSYPDLVDARARNHTLAELGAYDHVTMVLTGRADPLHLEVTGCTAGLMEALRPTPHLGRVFSAEEERTHAQVVLISWELWRGQLGGDPAIVGKSIDLDGLPHVVIGVLPPGFQFPLGPGQPAALYRLYPHDAEDVKQSENRGAHFLHAVGRLKPGVTAAQAQADLEAVVASMRRDHPGEHEDRDLSVAVKPLREMLVEHVRAPLVTLLIAVGCVLLIACANVANLLLARATVRQREIAIRTALGASRGRIVRQMLTESALLGLLGGAVGLLLALWLVDGLVVLAAPALPKVHAVALDARVLGVTVAVALATGIGFGLWPALHASRLELNDALKETARATAHARSRRARSALLVGEIAVALMLLAGAGLALRSFHNLSQVDPGFRPHHLVVASVDLPPNRYADDPASDRYYRRLTQATANLPGAQSVAFGFPVPFSGQNFHLSLNEVGQPSNPALPSAAFLMVSPGFFTTLGMQVKQGRTFTVADDQLTSPLTIVVSETFARRMFGSQNPIGKRLHIGFNDLEGEVIGVVADLRNETMDEPIVPSMYTPMGKAPAGLYGVLVRTEAEQAVMPLLRQAMLSVDRDLPPPLLSTMDALMADLVQAQHMLMVLLALFAAVAVVLTCIGIYGVTAYTVTQRTREIGIRVALGATDGAVVGMIVGEGLRLTLVAVAVGVAGAIALGRLARGLWFGVGALDLVTLVPVVLAVLGVTLLACFLPARRAAKVDPMVALRYE
jgi:putative ABC transport system permease protein